MIRGKNIKLRCYREQFAVAAYLKPLGLKMGKSLRVIAILVEIYILGNAIFLAYLICVWMESDSFAYSATEIDWWVEAGKRFVITSAIGSFLAGLVWFTNKHFLKWLGFKNKYLPVIIASVFWGSMCLASLIGAIFFAVKKPFL